MENTAEKKNKSRFLLIGMIAWVALVVVGVIIFFVSCNSGRAFDTKMRKGIEPFKHDADASGTKIVTFDMRNQVFTKSYLPDDLIASDPDEVGYILYCDDSTESVTKEYYRVDDDPLNALLTPKKVIGKVQRLKLRLTDYRTGLTVASKEFSAVPPREITSDTTSFHEKVDEDRIEEWIRSALNP